MQFFDWDSLEQHIRKLPRCGRCVLPATVPFIELDADGICRHCRDFVRLPLLGEPPLRALADRIRRGDDAIDCLVALSGGRDSCFVLHYVKKVLGLNPAAFTYDWGMVTPLGLANQALMCERLGVRRIHIADSPELKRRDVKRNLLAWLKRPKPGTIPLLMAGDKHMFYHAWRAKRRLGVSVLFFGMAEDLENEDFKEGFAGARTGGRSPDKRSYEATLGQKVTVASYFVREFLTNPRYLNRSLARTFTAFLSLYVLPHDFFQNLFSFIEWKEEEVLGTLRAGYGWASEPGNVAAWRVGDAACALTHHLYLWMTGFTENDFLRSNQIRLGILGRDKALEHLSRENRPDIARLETFCGLADLDPRWLDGQIRKLPTVVCG